MCKNGQTVVPNLVWRYVVSILYIFRNSLQLQLSRILVIRMRRFLGHYLCQVVWFILMTFEKNVFTKRCFYFDCEHVCFRKFSISSFHKRDPELWHWRVRMRNTKNLVSWSCKKIVEYYNKIQSTFLPNLGRLDALELVLASFERESLSHLSRCRSKTYL